MTTSDDDGAAAAAPDTAFEEKLADEVMAAILKVCGAETGKIVVESHRVADTLAMVIASFVAMDPSTKVPSRRRQICRERYGRMIDDGVAEMLADPEFNRAFIILKPHGTTQ